MSVRLPVEYHNENSFGVYSNCDSFVEASGTGDSKSFVATYAAGDITGDDGHEGIYYFTWTVADEEFISYQTEYELFTFLDDRPCRFAVDLTPGVTADTPEELNLYIGCMEATDTATEMQATGLGPRADSDMFGFFTVESVSAVYANPEVWNCVSSIGASQQITVLTAANANNLSNVNQKVYDATTGDGNKVKLVAEYVPTSRVNAATFNAEVRFWINDVLVAKHDLSGTYVITDAASEAMNFIVVGSNAAASSATAAMNLNYVKCDQLRA